jgi:hypothetical protein
MVILVLHTHSIMTYTKAIRDLSHPETAYYDPVLARIVNLLIWMITSIWI